MTYVVENFVMSIVLDKPSPANFRTRVQSFAAYEQAVEICSSHGIANRRLPVEEAALQKAEVGGAGEDCYRNDGVYGVDACPTGQGEQQRIYLTAEPLWLASMPSTVRATQSRRKKGSS
jgi:hypothetical protein